MEDLEKRLQALTLRLETLEDSPLPLSLSAEKSLALKLEKLNFYRKENAQEWSLLSSRVSSYITSQSFLVSAYAISMSNGNPKWGEKFTLWFPLIVGFVGLFASWKAYPGIIGASKIIRLWRLKQDRLYWLNPDEAAENPALAQKDHTMDGFHDDRPLTLSKRSHEVNDAIHAQSLEFAISSPWLFGTTWIVLIGLVLFLHLRM
ncbi:MAG: hypothetical protein H7308_16255 [Chthonomonadaceae bacterium]|nr:hypothetical protein [Chthonomonadaceae bacterium]